MNESINYQRDWDLYCAGKRIKESEKFSSWMHMIDSEEWDITVKNQKLTKENIEYVKAGFTGKEFINRKPPNIIPFEQAKKEDDFDVIIPFGVHKGEYMSKIDMKFIVRMSEASWLSKWPAVQQWIIRNQETIDQYKKEYNEGMDDLKELGKSLRGDY